MPSQDLKQLSTETAEALLTAIGRAASNADDRGSAALKELADAYSLVAGAMPKPAATAPRAATIY